MLPPRAPACARSLSAPCKSPAIECRNYKTSPGERASRTALASASGRVTGARDDLLPNGDVIVRRHRVQPDALEAGGGAEPVEIREIAHAHGGIALPERFVELRVARARVPAVETERAVQAEHP